METALLERIGLTKGEIKTYLALLKLGSSSTGPIAKSSQVSRSKLYSILDKLEKKGLASHVEKNGVIYFQAVEPEKIKDYIAEKQGELKKLEQDFDSFLPRLMDYKKAGETQAVNLYQGLNGLKVAHEHSYLKLKKGEEYVYMGVPAYQPEAHHRYWQKDHMRRVDAGIKTRILFNKDASKETLENRNSYPLCDARYMPTPIKTPAYFMIYKDTVMMSIASKEPIAVEIVNQEIADSFMAYFEEYWKRSKPFKEKILEPDLKLK